MIEKILYENVELRQPLSDERLEWLLDEHERLTDALRYVAGFDVPGYEGHRRSEDVALEVLGMPPRRSQA